MKTASPPNYKKLLHEANYPQYEFIEFRMRKLLWSVKYNADPQILLPILQVMVTDIIMDLFEEIYIKNENT